MRGAKFLDDFDPALGCVNDGFSHHARFAWASLVSVAVADFYVYLLATGAITDVRFF